MTKPNIPFTLEEAHEFLERSKEVSKSIAQHSKDFYKGKIPEFWDDAQNIAIPLSLFQLLVEKQVLQASDETRWASLMEAMAEELYKKHIALAKETYKQVGLTEEEIESMLREEE